MLNRTNDLPRLNYLWVGPPRENNSDIKDVIDMAERSNNPVFFYCLDEYLDSYKKKFSGKKRTAVGIDTYINKMQEHGDVKIQNFAEMMKKIRQERLTPPRDRISDRVSFKDIFSLFLLSCEGGYTLDTNVRMRDDVTNHSFRHYDHFKAPCVYDRLGSVDIWMMYASPNALNEPQKMMGRYSSKWDNIENMIRGNENNIYWIHNFHESIVDMMVDAVEEGVDLLRGVSKRRDPDWESTETNVN